MKRGEGVNVLRRDGYGATVRVCYNGILPDLFREGQGVIVQGKLTPVGTFDVIRAGKAR